LSKSETPAWGDIPKESGAALPDSEFEFRVHPGRCIVVVTFGKRLTIEDIGKYVEELRFHRAFRPAFSEIVDLREVEALDLQAEDFLKLADQVDPFSLEAKRAFVVRTAVQKHAARMHKILLSSRNIGIFESFQEAEAWICGSPFQ